MSPVRARCSCLMRVRMFVGELCGPHTVLMTNYGTRIALVRYLTSTDRDECISGCTWGRGQGTEETNCGKSVAALGCVMLAHSQKHPRPTA